MKLFFLDLETTGVNPGDVFVENMETEEKEELNNKIIGK